MHPIPWLRRRPALLLTLIAVTGLTAMVLHREFQPSIPTTDVAAVASIEVHLTAQPPEPTTENGQAATRMRIADRTQIQAVLDVFSRAERGSEHKCGASGTVTIYRADGGSEVLDILPGHDPAFYEYRYAGRINRVERVGFLSALQALGVGRVKLASP